MCSKHAAAAACAEKYVHLLIVAAAQFGAYAVYVCAIQQQFIDA